MSGLFIFVKKDFLYGIMIYMVQNIIDNMVWVIFIVFTLLFLFFSVNLIYHWKKFVLNKKISTFVTSLYLVVSLILFVIVTVSVILY